MNKYEEFICNKITFLFLKNHVFLLCYHVFIALDSCIFVLFLLNQNNPTAV